jgi:hypothetical protein
VRDAQVAAIAQALCTRAEVCDNCLAWAGEVAGTLIAPDALTDAEAYRLIGPEDYKGDAALFRATALVFRADLKATGEVASR